MCQCVQAVLRYVADEGIVSKLKQRWEAGGQGIVQGRRSAGGAAAAGGDSCSLSLRRWEELVQEVEGEVGAWKVVAALGRGCCCLAREEGRDALSDFSKYGSVNTAAGCCASAQPALLPSLTPDTRCLQHHKQTRELVVSY